MAKTGQNGGIYWRGGRAYGDFRDLGAGRERLVASGEKSATSGTGVSTLNFAFWTFGLWILMGAYVLGFWLISVVFYAVFKAFRP